MRKQVMGLCAAALLVSGFGSVQAVSAASSAAQTKWWKPSNPSNPIIGLNDYGASESGQASDTIEKVIAAGLEYAGTPYEFGSNRSTANTFDCSDFVQWIFKESLGLTLPADSRKQGEYVKDSGTVETDWHRLKRGDLMFFMSYNGTGEENYRTVDKSTEKITHVGIYMGNGQILHTYSIESGGVHVGEFADTAWEQRFLFGGSALSA